MKKPKSPKIDDLFVSIVEYAFTEWLVRRKVFAAFRWNYDHASSPARPFRDCLRSHIRYLFCHPNLDPGHLISSAFRFTSTPEGDDFWHNHSEAWKRFYADFRKKH